MNLRRFGRSLGSRIWRDPVEDEVDREIAFHVDMRARELAAGGLDPAEARRRALARFGDLEALRARLGAEARARNRATHRAEWLGDIGLDLRAALRQIARRRGLAAVAMLTLALGVGANAAMFDLASRLLLSPPPHITDPDRVVRFQMAIDDPRFGSFTMSTSSYPAFRNLARETTSFEVMAAVSPRTMVLGRDDAAAQIPAELVTGDYFTLLGARPALGRFLEPDDDRAPSGAPAAVLGDDLWRRRFASDAGIFGRPIELDGSTYTIVGVAPPGFNGAGIEPVDVWLPIHAGYATDPNWSQEGRNLVRTIGRLKPAIAVEAATQDATLAHQRAYGGFGGPEPRIVLAPLLPGLGPEGRTADATIALWLAGVAALVFVIAVANVSTLLLLRGVDRRREIAVRLAIGGGRTRVLRQFVVEGLTLATIGGALGLFVARWTGGAVREALMPNLAPRDLMTEPRVLALAAASVLVAGLVAAVAPAWRLRAPAIAADLGDRRAGFRRSLGRTGLLALQTALSVVLLVGAGLFLRSLHNVTTQHLGFDAERLLVAELQFPGAAPAAIKREAYLRALDTIRALPGVELAEPVQTLPFRGRFALPASVPERPEPLDVNGQVPFLAAAAPRLFDLMGMQVVEGRTFTTDDGRGPLVAVVNETLARSAWPGESALGHCVRVGFEAPRPSDSNACRTVVGVVSDTRQRTLVSADPVMQIYVPFEQVPTPPSDRGAPDPIWGLVVRAAGDPNVIARPVERALRDAAGGGVPASVQPYARLFAPQIRPWRLGATMLSIFGALALAMAAVGLYAVMAYAVAQRSREMGVRLTLGATRGAVVHLVLGEALRITGVGLVAGVGLALAAGGYVRSQLFDTSPTDATVFTSVVATLAAAATLATIVPAWRASRVDPILILKAE